MKSKRTSHEAQYTDAEVDRYHAAPFIPAPKKAFSFFNMSFRPISELRADHRGH
jgi:hypothetical protein